MSLSNMGGFLDVGDYGHNGFKTVVVAAVLILMLCIMSGGRLMSRSLQKAALAADDYILFIATAFSLGLCALAVDLPRVGGVGAFVSTSKDLTSPETAVAEKTFIAWMVIYGIAVASSKCAILLLYIRVFTTYNRTFTVSCYVVGSVVIAVAFVSTFGLIFQCRPVNFAWDKSVSDGTCLDFVAFERYTAIPNVITGAVMLVIPLPSVWKLKVPFAAKLALTATFLHGSIGFISSAARLARLFWPESAAGMNDASIAWTIWTINEPANYVIAACLPTLRPIFVRLLPESFFILSKKRSTNRPYTSTPKKSQSKDSSSRRSTFGISKTDAATMLPWLSQTQPDPRNQEDFQSSERELVASRGEFCAERQTGEKAEDLEKGRYMVTRTIEVGLQENFPDKSPKN